VINDIGTKSQIMMAHIYVKMSGSFLFSRDQVAKRLEEGSDAGV